MAIGKNVKLLRLAQGLTLEAVATAVGTDPQAISQMEKRDSKTSNFALQLAAFFQVDLAALMSDDFQDYMDTCELPMIRAESRPKLQWVSEREAELLGNFRACAPAEQGTIESIAKSLPKALFHELGSNKA